MINTEYEFREYPKCLYRDRKGEDSNSGGWVQNPSYETLSVANEDEELRALDDGWRVTADKSAPKAKAA